MMDMRGFVVGRPPLVIFVICLACFALTLMSFALYVKNTEIANPDISLDWNHFLMNFSQMGFCVLNGNQSEFPVTMAPPMTTKLPVTTPDSGGGLISTDEIKAFSVSMLLAVTPTHEFAQIPHNITYLTGTIYGEQLGLQGAAAEEPINVTMQLAVDWPQQCRSKHCSTVNILSCVYFQASQNVFPKGKKSPEVCELKNDTGIEYHARMRGDTVNAQEMYQPVGCKTQPSIRVHYKLDPTLTVYLSLTDRSVMNLHLMHTSYFLFVMVVTILIYAAIKGNKQIKSPDKVELLHHTDT